VSIVIL
jgi:hypothetical protein